jgi:transcriptional regulator with XRE-family HTH domain
VILVVEARVLCLKVKNPRIDGEKLKAARIERLLDRSELAERAGLNVRTVQGFEHNEWAGGSQLSTIRKLAEALGVDPREIIED